MPTEPHAHEERMKRNGGLLHGRRSNWRLACLVKLACLLLAAAVARTSMRQVFDTMVAKSPPFGLYPIYVRTSDGGFANRQITFGALGDSFYESVLQAPRS